MTQRFQSWHAIAVGILFSACLMATSKANAESDNVVTQREQQRKLFLQAEASLDRRRISEFEQYYEQLAEYPLRPYLTAQYLRERARTDEGERVQQFLAEHELSPLARSVRQAWLDRYMRQKNYGAFLELSAQSGNLISGRAQYQCFAVTAQLELQPESREATLRLVDKIWLSGESLPKSCDPLLKEWEEAGLRTPELVWQRVVLAGDGGRHTLIPYLQRLLPEDMQYLAEHFLRVRRNPGAIAQFKYLRGDYPQHEAQIVAYGFGRMIWREPDRALRAWQRLPEHIQLTPEQDLKIRQTFAIALSAKGHPHAAQWLVQLAPDEHNDVTLHWLLAQWLREQDWSSIIAYIPQLPEEQRDSEQWQYWFARALLEQQRTDAAYAVFERLAQQRSYYGFLAAAHVQQPLSLSHTPLHVDDEVLRRVQQLPGVQRAYELLQLDRTLSARREWNALLEHLSATEQRALARIAHEWGWHDQSIYTLGLLQEFDAVVERFPLAFFDLHERYASAAHIDVNWALAVSRRESAFRVDARSHAGAYGLMQLLPSTAKLVERADVSPHDLYQPARNIRLGTRYLANLQRRLDGNWILATAAYNAGIYRVVEWLPAEGMEADRWIELIPYAETRNYVKQVVMYQQIYHALRTQEYHPQLFAELVPMRVSAAQYQR